MRHFLSLRHVLAACSVASLALGVTVSPAPGVLIAVSGRAQRLTPGDSGTSRPAVLLAAVTARADPYLALAPGTQKQPGIVHPSSPSEEDWTTRWHAVILGMEPRASADLGATPDVTAKS